MTEQEKNEFWATQDLFTLGDVFSANGVTLLKKEAMERIAKEYQLTLAKGKIYTFREARDIMLDAEIKRRGKSQEALDKLEDLPEVTKKVFSYFQHLPESKKNDFIFIGKELNRIFCKCKELSEIEKGILLAQENHLVSDASALIQEFHNQRTLRALAMTVENLKNQPDSVNAIASRMFFEYKKGCSFGQIKMLLQKAKLTEEMQTQVIDKFYELLEPMLKQRYQNTNIRGTLLAKDVLKNYDEFDIGRIFDIIEANTQGLQIDRVRKAAYHMEDEPFIRDILLDANRKKMSGAAIAQEIKAVGCEYPIDFIIDTITELKSKGLVLPYNDIINSLKAPNKSKKDEATDELVPVQHDTLKLTPEGDFEEQEPLNNSQMQSAQPVSVGKKHTIKKREKATSAADKKAVIAGLIVAAGAISTAVLTTVFGVSPLEAAKNTAASISSFVAGSAFLGTIIPNTVSLVQNLSVFGLAAVGTLAWLKRRATKKLLDEEKEKERIKQAFEEVWQKREEQAEQKEQGGKKL